jgi:phage gp46-like protein
MAQNLKIDPATGDYVVVGGRPVETDNLDTECYFRIKISEGRWLCNPTIGSRFREFHRRHSPDDERAMITMGNRALKPLVDSGRAVSAEFSGVAKTRQSESFAVKYQQSGGAGPSVTFIPVR